MGRDVECERHGVVVAIPTFRRVEWVTELVNQLLKLRLSVPDLDFDVLVADNDPEGSAVAGLGARDDIRVLSVPDGGLASVRNSLLEGALGSGYRWMACLDDDELPTEAWLRELLRVQEAHDAQIVTGPLTVEDPTQLTLLGRVVRQRPVQPEGRHDGDVLTGNCLLDLDLIARSGARFSPHFNFTGGEDTHFFRLLRRSGARVAYAPGALVVERQDPSRFTDWLMLRRAYRAGQSSVRIESALGQGRSQAYRFAAFVAVLLRSAVLAPGLWVTGRREAAVVQALKVVRHAGRLRPTADGPSRYA